jgi:hypothetical protein
MAKGNPKKLKEKRELDSRFVVISFVFVCFCCNTNLFSFFSLWVVLTVKYCILKIRDEALRGLLQRFFFIIFYCYDIFAISLT